ncbi:hypothetical protein [Paenibacillus eucommiae]|uniref:Fibronectin type-III domain-containing protein n=1 Tax=Paenibacillus eucommiae TaxID=1355755 RepID=A0ABS4J2X4_9BACL|nr:hypothetical protein [Paenibacillus eucommiae]MBP1993164.1 hypothetical protein [Paenibacillus eucommiae]
MKKRAIFSFFIVFTLLTSLTTPVFAYDSLSTWKTRFDNLLTAYDTSDGHYGWTDTADSAYSGWDGTYTLNGLYRMYNLTKQTSYIEKLSQYINNMYGTLADTNNDGYLSWGTSHYAGSYREYVVHVGNIVSEWANFILTVRNDPTLSAATNPQGITYGTQANQLESVINSDLIPRFDIAWSEYYNEYLDHDDPGHSLPTNMNIGMAKALYAMAQVTPSKRHYLLWADLILGNFKSLLTTSGSSYTWNYWERKTPSDAQSVKFEDWGHAPLDIGGAISNYMRGGSFAGSDMTKLGTTVNSLMWNGSSTDPWLSYYVNGSGGYSGEFTLDFGDLERWKSGIWAPYEKYLSLHGGGGTRGFESYATLMQLHPGQSSPQAFTLGTPSSGATGQNTILSFQWQPSVNSADYRLQIATDSNFTNIVIDSDKIIYPYAAVSGLSYSTTYYWRVTSRNIAGATSTTSSRSFTTKAAPTYTLTFSHYDDRGTTAPKTYHYKQVLVDGVVVWEKDVADDAAGTWYNESVDITAQVSGKSNAVIKLRVIDKKSNGGNYSVSVNWDDLAITNSDALNGDFEASKLWYFSKAGSYFTGAYDTVIKHGGNKSYKISLPGVVTTSGADYGSIQQRVALQAP